MWPLTGIAMRKLFLIVRPVRLSPLPALADDWPQWMGPKRDNVWRETGILDKFPAGGPKVDLAGEGRRWVLRPGGCQWESLCRRLRLDGRPEEGDLRARQRERHGTRLVLRRENRQAAVDVRIPCQIHGFVPDRPAGDALCQRGPRLLRRDRRPAVVPRCRDRQGHLAEGLPEGLQREDTALGIRRPSRSSTATS